jgi:hypothetical protein
LRDKHVKNGKGKDKNTEAKKALACQNELNAKEKREGKANRCALTIIKGMAPPPTDNNQKAHHIPRKINSGDNKLVYI